MGACGPLCVQLWGGNPAVFVRDLTKAELAHMQHDAEEAAEAAVAHADEFLPESSVYLHVRSGDHARLTLTHTLVHT